MKKKAISTSDGPKAIGPYSQGIDTGDLVFVSGQVGIDPVTDAVFAAKGLGWPDVVKTTLWLTDTAHFATVNDIYSYFVSEPAPARSAPIVAALPRGLLISIAAIAKRG